MKTIFLIAYRNLFRHKGKSIIIGIILFFASLLMTFGNSFVSGVSQVLEDNIAGKFIGDVILISTNRVNNNILFDNSGETFPALKGYSNIITVLKNDTNVIDKYLPMALGFGMIMNEPEGRFFRYVAGVHFDEYMKMFSSNIIPYEGKLLSEKDKGILIQQETRSDIYDRLNLWVIPDGTTLDSKHLTEKAISNMSNLVVKDNVVFMGIGEDYTGDMRLPVKGIIRYKDYNHFWSFYTIMDIDSFRECFGYISSSEKVTEIPEEKKEIMEMSDENLDEMFGGQDMIEKDVTTDKKNTISHLTREKITNLNEDSGVYNIISIKLKKGISLKKGLDYITGILLDAGKAPFILIDARPISWKDASGQVYSGTSLINSIVNVFIIFLFFVVIIVIMNTLNMAVIERTSEIAMMRSIGTRKSSIGSMIFTETFILAMVFGLIGIFAGFLVVKLINFLNITPGSNEMAAIFFGSDRMPPNCGFNELIKSFIELIIFTSIATLYPINLAVKIKPIEAIHRD